MEKTQTKSIESISPGKGPYDLALFIATSFGRSLPVVVIIALAVAGGWYYIKDSREMSYALISARTELATAQITSEKALATAKVEQANAEAKAQSAVDKARGDIMAEQAKRISELNDASVAVSKRIQELVSGQLQNMTKLEEQMTSQMRKQQQDAEKQIESLAKQVDALEKQRNALTVRNSMVAYEELKSTLSKELATEFSYRVDQIVDLLRARLTDPDVRARVAADCKDYGVPWRLRVVLTLELYRLSGEAQYLSAASELLENNKFQLDGGIGIVLRGPSGGRQRANDPAITALSMKLALDEAVPIDSRASLLQEIEYGDAVAVYLRTQTPAYRERAAKTVLGFVLDAAARAGFWRCDSMMRVLRKFSEEASVVAARELRDDPRYVKNKKCGEDALKEWADKPPLDVAERSKWLAPSKPHAARVYPREIRSSDSPK